MYFPKKILKYACKLFEFHLDVMSGKVIVLKVLSSKLIVLIIFLVIDSEYILTSKFNYVKSVFVTEMLKTYVKVWRSHVNVSL